MKQLVFDGKRFKVFKEEVKTPQPHTKEFIVHPGAVVILPLLNEEEILLIKNNRFVVGETLWELPAGTLEQGEALEEAAKRELIEETGYSAERVEPLLSFYASPGMSDEIMHIFAASQLHHVGQSLDPTEEIEVFPLKWKDVLTMIHKGEIHDSKTIAAILFYLTYKRS